MTSVPEVWLPPGTAGQVQGTRSWGLMGPRNIKQELEYVVAGVGKVRKNIMLRTRMIKYMDSSAARSLEKGNLYRC